MFDCRLSYRLHSTCAHTALQLNPAESIGPDDTYTAHKLARQHRQSQTVDTAIGCWSAVDRLLDQKNCDHNFKTNIWSKLQLINEIDLGFCRFLRTFWLTLASLTIFFCFSFAEVNSIQIKMHSEETAQILKKKTCFGLLCTCHSADWWAFAWTSAVLKPPAYRLASDRHAVYSLDLPFSSAIYEGDF